MTGRRLLRTTTTAQGMGVRLTEETCKNCLSIFLSVSENHVGEYQIEYSMSQCTDEYVAENVNQFGGEEKLVWIPLPCPACLLPEKGSRAPTLRRERQVCGSGFPCQQTKVTVLDRRCSV